MASIIINNLPKQSTSKKPYLYADLHLDLKMAFTTHNQLWKTPEKVDLEVDYDIKAVTNGLVNLFTTSPGENILNPTFGLDLRYFLFEPLSNPIAKQIQNIIEYSIRAFEQRVRLLKVTVVPNPDTNEYHIEIFYNVKNIEDKELILKGKLNNNGYVFV